MSEHYWMNDLRFTHPYRLVWRTTPLPVPSSVLASVWLLYKVSITLNNLPFNALNGVWIHWGHPMAAFFANLCPSALADDVWRSSWVCKDKIFPRATSRCHEAEQAEKKGWTIPAYLQCARFVFGLDPSEWCYLWNGSDSAEVFPV